MAKTARETKSKQMSFRMSAAQRDLIRRAATARGQSMSEFIVESACTIAEHDPAEERYFSLPPEQWKAFLAILDRPAVASPALQRLLT
jgi:uncharacterized protein (DUF1778 family)